MRFVSPHRSIIDKAVSGSVTATYVNSWLTDASPAYPVRTEADLALTVSGVGLVDVVAVTHHNIVPAATIDIGALGTIPTSAWRPNGIPRNFVTVLDPAVNAGSIVLEVTGNGGPVIIGSLYAGQSYLLPDFRAGRRFSPQQPFPWEGEFSSLTPYDAGIAEQRRVSGTLILNDAQWEELLLTFEAQKLGNRPALWLDNDTDNDAWLCQFSIDEEHNEGLHSVNLQITELPRLRWPA